MIGFLAGLLATMLLALPSQASPKELHVALISTSISQHYGIYLVADKEMDCRFVRYRVSGSSRHIQSIVLLPGQGVVVPLGRDWTPGLQSISIRSVGCSAAPSEARRVVIRARSPDHAARASKAIALINVKADALR